MRFVVTFVLCVALCGSAAITSAVEVESDCQTVRGTIEAEIIGAGDGCLANIAGEVFDETGAQIGTTTACIENLVQRSSGGAIHAELHHTYTIGSLTFRTEDEGVLARLESDVLLFENRLTIVDGATGFLRAHGIINGSEINLSFTGRICEVPAD